MTPLELVTILAINAFNTIAPPMLLIACIGGVATLIARRKK